MGHDMTGKTVASTGATSLAYTKAGKPLKNIKY